MEKETTKTEEIKHFHMAMYVDEVLVDECALCGKSWRDTDVHKQMIISK